MKFKKLAAAAAITAAMIGISAPANALPIGLGLIIDESGSISASDWTLQTASYANVLSGSLINTDSSLVIGVWKFDDTVELVFAPTLIASAADKTNLVNAINGMVQGGGLTAIGSAVTAGYTAFDLFGDAGNLLPMSDFFSKVVLDVSTDGFSNTGIDPITASTNALAAGVAQVNCLGVGAGASCAWNPASSLDFAATSQATFQAALELKIGTETGQIPEPTSLALLGLGLAAMGALRRKQRV